MEAFLIFSVAFVALTIGVVAGVLAVTVLIVKAAATSSWSPPPLSIVDDGKQLQREGAHSGEGSRSRVGQAVPEASVLPPSGNPQTPTLAMRQKPRCALCEAVRAALRLPRKKLTGE